PFGALGRSPFLAGIISTENPAQVTRRTCETQFLSEKVVHCRVPEDNGYSDERFDRSGLHVASTHQRRRRGELDRAEVIGHRKVEQFEIVGESLLAAASLDKAAVDVTR